MVLSLLFDGSLTECEGQSGTVAVSIVRSGMTRMTPSVRKLGIVGLDPVSLHVVHAVSDWLSTSPEFQANWGPLMFSGIRASVW